jgi:molecular chaperone HtpG
MPAHQFEADVRQILHLVTHSLYSDREIFLRELISNASDALDRARFESLKDEGLREVSGDPSIRLSWNGDERTLSVTDDGIGLTREEAIEHLGTIAESGTKAFAQALKDKGESPEGLIGQFGVGFYSAFMVADKVVVDSLSGKADSGPIRWISDGGDSYELLDGDKEERGTRVTLHMREDAAEFLEAERLKYIVKSHSDFVPWPVLVDDERANESTAIWTKNPAEVTEEEYNTFYKHISNDWQDPLITDHRRVEGTLVYDALLYIPSSRPMQLDHPLEYKVGLKLYQKKVKILDSAETLLPRYLRFVSGIVDSPDVNLNVSREILQQTPVVQTIRKQLTKRVLKKLKEVGEKDPETYNRFWSEFGHVIKEGTQEDSKSKELITSLLRYRTTTSDGELRSLAQIRTQLPEGQDTIWYYTNVDKARIEKAPVLEGFRKRGWEVLLMDEPVDEWVAMAIDEFDGVQLKSVTKGELPEEESEEDDPIAQAAKDQARPLVGWLGTLLEDEVAEVRMSSRLTDSPSVLVDQEGALGANLEKILAAANQAMPSQKRVLEINPEHPMVKTLAKLNNDGQSGLEPFARLLHDHALISEGKLDDAAGFARRLQVVMEKAAAGLAATAPVNDDIEVIDPEIVT